MMLKSIYKEHNLKSIHNKDVGGFVGGYVEINIQRTQFKINSQLDEVLLGGLMS